MTITLSADSPMRHPDFIFGTATSSYQIEGARDERATCIWDTFCATPGKIKDGSNGDNACEHLTHWREDVELISSLGFDAYRFSISWPRILNEHGDINQDGIDFYLNMLDTLIEKGIKPFVTLYHWDLPQCWEDKGGWLNRDTAYAFADYVDVVTKAFGDRVYSYATLNEPFCSAYLGYEMGVHAPGKVGKEFGKKAIHHLLLAHGLGMRVLRRNSPNSQNGIVLNFTPMYPETPNDQQAAELAHTHFNDWYIRPILKGSYPALIDDIPQAHRPDIAPGDLAIIAEPIDYLGVNYYFREFVCADSKEGFKQLPPPADSEVTAMGWEVYPQALTELLLRFDQEFDLPPIIITENGLASDDVNSNGIIDDKQRQRYFQSHFAAVDKAMVSGIDIHGYFVWSLMDNFEWAEGYEKRFGIVHVDYDTQVRTPKESARQLKWILSQR